MKNLKLLTLAAVLMLALFLPIGAQAQSLDLIPDKGDKVIFGGEFTLSEGEVLNGDLISFGGNLILEEGSLLDGDLVSMGGNVEVSGAIAGDLIAMGSNINLNETALIEGSLALLGSNIHRSAGAQVIGDIVTNSDGLEIEFPGFPEIQRVSGNFDFDQEFFRNPSRFTRNSLVGNVGTSVIVNLFMAFAMAAVAVLVMLFLPKHTRRIADAVLAEPVAAGGLSLVTFVALPILAVLLSITLILIPVVLLLAFLCALALVFGWVAIGLEVGERLAESLKQDWTAPVKAGAGTFILSFVVGLVGLVPCLGWLASFLMVLLSFGAVLLTRFGTQSYPQLEIVPVPAPKKAAKTKKATTKKKAK